MTGTKAWWLLLFYGLPALLGPMAKLASAGGAGVALQYVLTLAGFALSIWGFIEIGCLPGNAESNSYGPNPIEQTKRASHSR